MRQGGRPGLKLEDVIRDLARSPNVCDQRKARDLEQLAALAAELWNGRFAVAPAGVTTDRSLVLQCALKVGGLLAREEGGEPVPHGEWVFALMVPPNFPLAAPLVRFVPPTVPLCGHVVHAGFLPSMSHLPAEFQAYVREGHGFCCYARRSQWRTDASTHSLALVVRQVSKIVGLAAGHGEEFSLNPTGRDLALRLARENRLPLGEPLPYPPGAAEGGSCGPDGGSADADDDADAMEWDGAVGTKEETACEPKRGFMRSIEAARRRFAPTRAS